MKSKNLNWIIWAGGIALLLCWGYGMASRQRIMQAPASTDAQAANPYTRITVVGREWVGVPIPKGWRMVDQNLTSVRVDWRINGDPQRTFIDPTNGHYEFGSDVAYKEYRVNADQTANETRILCTFTKEK